MIPPLSPRPTSGCAVRASSIQNGSRLGCCRRIDSCLIMSFLIRNLSQIATPRGAAAARGVAMRALAVGTNQVIVIRDGRFAFIGDEGELPPEMGVSITEDFDALGATALPGFVDS